MTEELSISPVASPSRSTTNSPAVPSYRDSQLDKIVRHQRRINGANSLKLPPATRRKRGNIEIGPLEKDWRFAGWGSIKHLDSLVVPDHELGNGEAAKKNTEANKGKSKEQGMGVWLGTGIAGVAVAGSPFYSFPAVIAVAGVLSVLKSRIPFVLALTSSRSSPICLLVATLLLSFWRPVLNELARSLPLSGANYIYLLNTTSAKYLVLFAAALTFLDDIATAVVSAGFAATYLVAQVTIPIPISVLAILITVGVGCLGLFGLKNGAGVTCSILIFHVSPLVPFLEHGANVFASRWPLCLLSSSQES